MNCGLKQSSQWPRPLSSLKWLGVHPSSSQLSKAVWLVIIPIVAVYHTAALTKHLLALNAWSVSRLDENNATLDSSESLRHFTYQSRDKLSPTTQPSRPSRRWLRNQLLCCRIPAALVPIPLFQRQLTTSFQTPSLPLTVRGYVCTMPAKCPLPFACLLCQYSVKPSALG